MRGPARLLWSLCLVMLVGCRSVATESTRLSDRPGGAPFTSAKRFSAQTSDANAQRASRRTRRQEQVPDTSSSSSSSTATGDRGSTSEVPSTRTAVEASGQDSSQHRSDRSQPAPGTGHAENIEPAEYRGTQDTPVIPIPTTADVPGSADSVQEIILTGHAGDEAATDETDATSAPVIQPGPIGAGGRPDTLSPGTTLLAAPAPGNAPSPPSMVEPVNNESEEETELEPNVAARVFDVFGVGGESRAAQQQADGSAQIGLAERGTSRPRPEAEAIARKLEEETSVQSVYWQEDLEKLITLLEAQVAQQKPGDTAESQDRYLRQHVALRMLYLIANRRPEALQAIPGVPDDEQEFWTRMFWALSSIFDEEAMPNSTVRAAETVAQLRAAIRQIESRASLDLRGAAFCQQIDGFGDFVPFRDWSFSAGQPVLIYTEVRNFQSEPTDEGTFRTALRSTITIQQESVSGPVVFRHDLPATEDHCQSRRQDYFHSYRIQFPETLQPGPHVLTLDVTDTLTGKKGSTTLNFVVP